MRAPIEDLRAFERAFANDDEPLDLADEEALQLLHECLDVGDERNFERLVWAAHSVWNTAQMNTVDEGNVLLRVCSSDLYVNMLKTLLLLHGDADRWNLGGNTLLHYCLALQNDAGLRVLSEYMSQKDWLSPMDLSIKDEYGQKGQSQTLCPLEVLMERATPAQWQIVKDSINEKSPRTSVQEDGSVEGSAFECLVQAWNEKNERKRALINQGIDPMVRMYAHAYETQGKQWLQGVQQTQQHLQALGFENSPNIKSALTFFNLFDKTIKADTLKKQQAKGLLDAYTKSWCDKWLQSSLHHIDAKSTMGQYQAQLYEDPKARLCMMAYHADALHMVERIEHCYGQSPLECQGIAVSSCAFFVLDVWDAIEQHKKEKKGAAMSTLGEVYMPMMDKSKAQQMLAHYGELIKKDKPFEHMPLLAHVPQLIQICGPQSHTLQAGQKEALLQALVLDLASFETAGHLAVKQGAALRL